MMSKIINKKVKVKMQLGTKAIRKIESVCFSFLTKSKALMAMLLISTSVVLSSCGTYGSSFECKDAAGLYCVPLSIVDQKISSGEIIEVELKERGLCKGAFCSARSYPKNLERPNVKFAKNYKLKLFEEHSELEKQEMK